jgi:hypothetical protein
LVPEVSDIDGVDYIALIHRHLHHQKLRVPPVS